MNSLSVFGVDLPDTYQLGYISVANLAPMFGIWEPSAGLVVYNTTTGDFFFADDMPVKIKPGFLLQGRRAKSGDSDVFHGGASGIVLPNVVLSTLGTSMPAVPDSDDTCYRFINDPNTAKHRVYGVNASTYVLTNYRALNHDSENFHCGTSVTVGRFSRQVNDKGHTLISYYALNGLYELNCTVCVTGNLRHMKKGSSDNRPNYLQGYRKLSIKTLNGGGVVRSDVNTSTQLNFVPLSKPTSLAALTSELVLSGVTDDGKASLNEDLLTLDGLSSGNAPWLSSYNAVTSMKFIDMQWLEFIRDSYHWRELIPGIRNLYNLRNPKGWSELYLWWIYGIRPTISDVLLISNKVSASGGISLSALAKKFATRHVQYGTAYDDHQTLLGRQVKTKCNSRVDLHTRIQPQTLLGQLFLVLQSVGLGIDARNLWELIPYSFVVDWFVNTADAMKWIDSLSFPCWYDIDQCVTSDKKTATLPADRYFNGATGYVTLSTYKRVVSSTVPVQPFELRFTDPSGHWLEGSALLITRH